MSENKIWKTEEEFNTWFDAYYEQQVSPVEFQMKLDDEVNALIKSGVEYSEAFDQVYTIDVLKKLKLLPVDFEATEETKSMTEVLNDIDRDYVVMVEKESTNEKITTSEE